MRSCAERSWPTTRSASCSIAAVTPGEPKPSSYSLQPTMPTFKSTPRRWANDRPSRIATVRMRSFVMVRSLAACRRSSASPAAGSYPCDRSILVAYRHGLRASEVCDLHRVAERIGDSLSLAVNTPDGLVLVVGCSHPGISLLLAQSGQVEPSPVCPLLGVKRTWPEWTVMSAFDPKRT